MIGFARTTADVEILPILVGDFNAPTELGRLLYLKISSPPTSADFDLVKSRVSSLLGRQAAESKQREEIQVQFRSKAADFISASLSNLDKRENRERNSSIFWYITSGLALLSGVAFSFWRLSRSDFTESSLFSTLEVGITSTVAVGLTLAYSKFAFTLGKAHMVEALRNADRRHAISFGDFYLNAKGSDVEWDELKEAFQHWNIDNGSAFISQSGDDFDPRLIERALEMAKIIANKN